MNSMDTNPEIVSDIRATAAAADADPIKRLLQRAREMNRTPRSPVITSTSTGVKYARALQTVRKYRINV